MIIRAFLKPNATCWLDYNTALPNIMTAWAIAVKEGAIGSDGFIIPIEQVHHMVVYDNTMQQPTLTVLPGGKPRNDT